MTKVLFICHGNICRSPMAEFVFKDLVEKAGMNHLFEIDSAATSTEEIGNPIYPPAIQCLKNHGITGASHQARQVTKADYEYFDYLILMDRNNLRNIRRIIPIDYDNKIFLLMSFAQKDNREVADPWYTGDFEITYRDVLTGCKCLLKQLTEKK